MTLPTDGLHRSVPFTLARTDEDTDGLTLDGYAAVFDSPTRIDSWEGLFDEQISRGAFAKTLSERAPVIQFDHGHHPLVGSIPIGTLDRAEEDAHGLHIVARLHDNWLIQPVRDAIRDGSITGMSFRFSVVKETIDDSGDIPLRTITEVKLYEAGPVVFPAYTDTSVGVRSLLADPAARAELARALISGTPTDLEAAQAGTSGRTGAADHLEPRTHSGTPSVERERALTILESESQ